MVNIAFQPGEISSGFVAIAVHGHNADVNDAEQVEAGCGRRSGRRLRLNRAAEQQRRSGQNRKLLVFHGVFLSVLT
jgi:hypothetical protein